MGGYPEDRENVLLDRYILAQSPKRRPRVCFVPTASGDSADYVERYTPGIELSIASLHTCRYSPDRLETGATISYRTTSSLLAAVTLETCSRSGAIGESI